MKCESVVALTVHVQAQPMVHLQQVVQLMVAELVRVLVCAGLVVTWTTARLELASSAHAYLLSETQSRQYHPC